MQPVVRALLAFAVSLVRSRMAFQAETEAWSSSSRKLVNRIITISTISGGQSDFQERGHRRDARDRCSGGTGGNHG